MFVFLNGTQYIIVVYFFFLIWIFTANDIPINVRNICKCIHFLDFIVFDRRMTIAYLENCSVQFEIFLKICLYTHQTNFN